MNEERTASESNNVDKTGNTDVVQSKSSKEVIPTNSISHSLNLLDERQMAAAESLMLRLTRSEKGGIKTVQDGIAILLRAQDFNLPFTACLEHIHVINGKTGIDVHLIKALLLRAGVTWTCVQDYTPLYEYTDGFNVYVDGELPDYVIRCKTKEEAEKVSLSDDDKIGIYPVKWYTDVNGNFYKDYQLSSNKFGIAVNREQVNAITQSGKIAVWRIPSKPVDYVTSYELRRTIKGQEITSIGRFSYSEALKADMFKKDTYVKYARILIGHRAFTYAARDIASEVLFGVMEATELKIVSNVNLSDADVVDAEIIELS